MSMSTPTPGAASELMPCPAGHDAAKLCREKHNQTDPRSQYPIHWAYVDCRHRHEDGSICGWHLGGFPTAAEAIAAWNTRTPAPVTEGAQREAVAWMVWDTKNKVFCCAERSRDAADRSRDGYVRAAGRYNQFILVPLYPPPPDRVQPERVEAPIEFEQTASRIVQQFDLPPQASVLLMVAIVTALREAAAPAPPTDASGGVTEERKSAD